MFTIRPSLGAEVVPSCMADTLIIGAGPSGLAAARRLVEAGLRPVIVEKSTNFGELMRSIQHGSFVVDLGREELYSRIPEVDTLWNNLLGQNYRPYPHRVGSLYEMSGFRNPATYQDYWYQGAGGKFARTLAQRYWEKFRECTMLALLLGVRRLCAGPSAR